MGPLCPLQPLMRRAHPLLACVDPRRDGPRTQQCGRFDITAAMHLQIAAQGLAEALGGTIAALARLSEELVGPGQHAHQGR